MATRRADQLEHALAQVAASAGWTSSSCSPRTASTSTRAGSPSLAGGRVRTVVAAAAADALFGDVLAAAADAAGGDVVLKMDDDDWYGPDVVTDLLLARGYSGAELVGMPAEYLYLVAAGRHRPRATTSPRRTAASSPAAR